MITAKSLLRYKHYARALAISVLLVTVMGCATFVRTDPSWSTPVDLDLTDDAMAGAVVHVGCGTTYKEGRLVPSRHAFCEALATNIEHMGAAVLADWREAAESEDQNEIDREQEELAEKREEKIDTEQVLFRVDYVDRLEGSRSCDGWSIVFFLMSGALYPLVCDDPAQADLLFYDGEVFALQEKVRLRVVARKYIGIGALYFHAMQWINPDLDRKHGDLLGTTLQNHVHRFYFRTHRSLTAVAPPGAS